MPDQFQLAQVPLQGAETLNQPNLPALESRSAGQGRPSPFGGKLLPERGLLANVLLAGILGLGAGSRAQNPLEAAGLGALAPFQFKLQQRAQQRAEEAQDLRAEQVRGQITATEAGTQLAREQFEDLKETSKQRRALILAETLQTNALVDILPDRLANETRNSIAQSTASLARAGLRLVTPEELKKLESEQGDLPDIVLPDGKGGFNSYVFEDFGGKIDEELRIQLPEKLGGDISIAAGTPRQFVAGLIEKQLGGRLRLFALNAAGADADAMAAQLAAIVRDIPSLQNAQGLPNPFLMTQAVVQLSRLMKIGSAEVQFKAQRLVAELGENLRKASSPIGSTGPNLGGLNVIKEIPLEGVTEEAIARLRSAGLDSIADQLAAFRDPNDPSKAVLRDQVGFALNGPEFQALVEALQASGISVVLPERAIDQPVPTN